MASEQNILIKVTGEADLTDAQLQLREMTNRSKELEKQMAELDAQQRRDANDLKASIQGEKELSAALKQNAQYYGNLKGKVQEAINANTKSISTLKQQVSTMNAVNNSGGKLAMQIRAIREQLAQMEMSGDTSSQAFIDLSVQAAKLQDQMGDTSKQISILASDTKNLDAAMSVGQGIAGAFNVATAAAALFGGESEELNEAFLKVQASLAVLNGVQQVANTLNKDSAANVVIRTALQKLFNREKAKETAATAAAATAATAATAAKGAETVATTAATKATWSFTAALLANPVMLIVAGVAALAAGVYALVKAFDKSAQAERKAKKALEDYELQSTLTSRAIGQLQSDHSKAMRSIEINENKALNASKARHDTTLSQAQMELQYLKQRATEQNKYTAEAIKQNNAEQIASNKAVIAQRAYVNTLKKGTDDYKQALTDLTDMENNNHQIYQRGTDLIKERDAAQQAVFDKEQQIADERLNIIKELEQTRIDLMNDGIDKELKQLDFNYKERLKTIQRGSALEKAVKEKYEKEKAEIERKYYLQSEELMVQELKNASDANENDLALKQQYFEAEAQYKILSLDKEKLGEDKYAAEVEAIRTDLNNKLKQLEDKRISDKYATLNNEAQMEMNVAEEILASHKSSWQQRQQADADYKAARDQMLDNQESELKERYAKGLVTEKEYNAQLEAINHERNMNLIADEEARFQKTQEMAQAVMQFVGDMASEIFGAISDSIQQQLDDLDNMYTTDAEEAKEDANKKYITEKELEQKKLELRRKAAVAEKLSAVFSIGLNTAMAIMQAIAQFGPPPSPMGIAGIAMATALGATQLAIALSKPLPKYAKGRAGGKGEYALVGEKGPELMYVPDGASIVPNNKLSMPKEWVNYGLPRQPHFMGPTMDDTARTTMAMQFGLMAIDYDRLGKAVADNIPAQKAVSVNVDRRGITIDDGADQHTYLNKKYTGQWT